MTQIDSWFGGVYQGYCCNERHERLSGLTLETMNLKIKRIYDKSVRNDGFRVLIDRVWPRGVSKEKARLDLWFKEIAPSTGLRKWFAHDPAKWREFRLRYFKELDYMPDTVQEMKDMMKSHDCVTLLYSAHDTECNQAAALMDYLGKHG